MVVENLLAYKLLTVTVTYKLPDYSILQEFIWQVVDNPRHMPRVFQFLKYWRDNLEGPIVKVEISQSPYGFGKYESSCFFTKLMS